MLMICLLVSLLALLTVLAVFAREGYRWVRLEMVRWRSLPTWPDEIPIAAAANPTEEEHDEPGN